MEGFILEQALAVGMATYIILQNRTSCKTLLDQNHAAKTIKLTWKFSREGDMGIEITRDELLHYILGTIYSSSARTYSKDLGPKQMIPTILSLS